MKELRICYPRERNLIMDLHKKFCGDLFIDVGAGEGQYCINLADKFKEVWAVEPFTRHWVTLNKNIRELKICNIKTFKVAVGDKVGKLNLYGDNVILLSHGSPSAKKTLRCTLINETLHFDKVLETVEETTLATLLCDRRADLVKVDVEGYELEVLKGAEPVINQIDAWQIELHDWAEKAEIKNFLETHGYRVVEKSAEYIYDRVSEGGWFLALKGE